MEVLSQLIADRKELREDLFRLAEQNGVVAVQDAKSGIALAYEFFAHESILQHTAKIATELEERIIEVFAAWVRHPTIQYEVVYRSEFVPHGEEAKLRLFDTVLLQNPPSRLRNKILLEELKALFPDTPSDELALFEKELVEEEIIKAERASVLSASFSQGGEGE
jgi:hypothetical protein